MKFSHRTTSVSDHHLDALAEPNDVVDVHIIDSIGGGRSLYVDVNGITILRIGRIQSQIEVTRDD